MQSADSITTAASVPVIRRLPHEYERDTLSFRYEECKSCRSRTQLTCIKCGFCYSCHWKKEEVERRELRNKLESIYLSLSLSSEPICTYHRCHHKFSLHGLGRSYRCKCKHPMNKTLGVFKRYP
jgi:hypothetical protein